MGKKTRIATQADESQRASVSAPQECERDAVKYKYNNNIMK